MEHGNREKLNWVGVTERHTVDSVALLPDSDGSASGWGGDEYQVSKTSAV